MNYYTDQVHVLQKRIHYVELLKFCKQIQVEEEKTSSFFKNSNIHLTKLTFKRADWAI